MEERIKALLEAATTLRPIIVDEGQAKNIFPCITFHFYNEDGLVFGAGKAEIEKASCQIDFWYENKTSTKYGKISDRIQEVKQAIINEPTFTHPKKDGNYEDDKKKYHTYLTFDLIKKGGE